MGQRIDDENEMAKLREDAHKWRMLMKLLDSMNLPGWDKVRAEAEQLALADQE